MRCFFMRNGHIGGVEELPGLSDDEAIAKGRELFEHRKAQKFDGFEIWERSRMLIQYPEPTSVVAPRAPTDADVLPFRKRAIS
jgi:hypothetical protein